MQMIVLFGLPGAGKSYVGNILQQNNNFFHFDADFDLPEDMKIAIQEKAIINDSMRDIFFQNIIKRTYFLKSKYKKIVISQTFIKEKYRNQFLQAFPQAKFVLIKSDDSIRENRLVNRNEYPLDIEYARKMVNIFDKARIKHVVIYNNKDGKEDILKIG